jgi:FlaA1/EpsC-like NDP-sugar epimerase
MVFSKQYMPRWLIFLIDVAIVAFSIVLAYMLRFNFHIPQSEINLWPQVFAVVLGLRMLSFAISKTYAGIISYTSTEDAVRISVVALIGSALFAGINLVFYYFVNEKFVIPFSVIIIELLAVVLLMTAFRVLVKITYLQITNPSGEKTKVVIFGAGEAGIITKRALDRDVGIRYKVVAFIDENKKLQGKKVEGVGIYSLEKLDPILSGSDIDNVILSVQNLSSSKKQEIVDVCLKYNVRVFGVPPVSTWINGELSFNQIKKIKIEDLLERDVIILDTRKISEELNGKVVLITGAAGSIGSELVRQIIPFKPQKVVLIDQAESALFDLEVELLKDFNKVRFEIAVADICNPVRMQNIFDHFKPEVVYHAAAYKHVPMMENNPSEALYTNIAGTKSIADLSMAHNVKKFIMISTDKAVNPTSVMGASKRIAEIYIQSLNKEKRTRFITTRFGNVLGSNGSAVTLFRRQIENGGPVTVTHPEVIRYFMTIPEACRLVLEAGMMGNGGEIYLFDMGKPVKIIDLAKKMINLSGLEIGKDIEIVFTGLRPGEKLFEELLNDQENTMPTHHPQIMIGKIREYETEKVHSQINELIELFAFQDNSRIVKGMKELVPEYKSQNSIYEQLDN